LIAAACEIFCEWWFVFFQAFGGSLFFPAGTRFDLMAFWEFHFKKKASICSLF